MNSVLRKYTSLPVLLNVLNKKCITLSEPRNWEDKNDSYYIEVYREKYKYKSVLATCFVQGKEQYHHWKIYAGSISGICIEFDLPSISDYFLGPEFECGPVIYASLNQLGGEIPFDENRLPFYKRIAYLDESEFRAIYHSCKNQISTYDVRIDIGCIQKIIINPWLPTNLVKNLISTLRLYTNGTDIRIFQSTLLENERWQRIADEQVNPIRNSKTLRGQQKS